MTSYLGRLIQRAWGADAANERLTPARSRWQSAAPELGEGPFETGAEITSTSAAAKQPVPGTQDPLTQGQTDSAREIHVDGLGTPDNGPLPASVENNVLSAPATAARLEDQQVGVSDSVGPAAISPKPEPAKVHAEGRSTARFPQASSEVGPIGTTASEQKPREASSDPRTTPSQRQAVPHEPHDSFHAGLPAREPSAAQQPFEAQAFEPTRTSDRLASASPPSPQEQASLQRRSAMKDTSSKATVPNHSHRLADESSFRGVAIATSDEAEPKTTAPRGVGRPASGALTGEAAGVRKTEAIRRQQIQPQTWSSAAEAEGDLGELAAARPPEPLGRTRSPRMERQSKAAPLHRPSSQEAPQSPSTVAEAAQRGSAQQAATKTTLTPPKPRPLSPAPAKEAPRLHIGTLRVEVVPTAPAKPAPPARAVVVVSASTNQAAPRTNSKLRFGLGQM